MKNFFQQTFGLVRLVIAPVFFLTVLSGTIDQLISLSLENELRSLDGATSKIWLLAATSIANSFVWPWFMALLVLYAIRSQLWSQARSQNENGSANWFSSWTSFLHRFGAQSFIETMRAWGKCLIYSLFLILPGLWKFLEYMFIPWVVCFHPRYDRGELDALKESSTLFRKRWLSLLLLTLVFFVLIPLVMTALFEEYRLIWITPYSALGLHFIDAVIHLIYFQVVTLIFFQLLKKEGNHESAFQLERN